MAKILLVCMFCLAFLCHCECSSHEDWGLLNRGWSWFNWYYYWYWQHGQWGKTSDHDTICQRLWGVDYNRIQDRVDYEISLQARILKNSSVDKSYRQLFSNVNMKKIRGKPTFQAFIDLLNDFTPSRNTAASKKLEMDKILENINKFLSAVIKTRVFQETYWYLVRNNFVIADKAQFKESLYDLWFNKGNITTENPSAFQKVFAGEIVNNPYKLSVRNWIQFHMLESKGLDYFGYFRHYRYEPKVVSIMFSWKRGSPVTDNMLIGTSPEFEIALYTLCFFTSPATECECKVNIQKIMVKTTTSPDGSKIFNSHFEV